MPDMKIPTEGGSVTLSREGFTITLAIEGPKWISSVTLVLPNAAALARELLKAAGEPDHAGRLMEAVSDALAFIERGRLPEPYDNPYSLICVLKRTLAEAKGATPGA